MNKSFILVLLTALCVISTSDLEDSLEAPDESCLLQVAHKAGFLVNGANPTALAQMSSEDARAQKSTAKEPIPSGWFGSFSEDESTYTDGGLNDKHSDPTYDVMYGRDPQMAAPGGASPAIDDDFFHESRSGGPTAAWQTHPSVPGDIVGNEAENENPWRYTPHGWVQDYEAESDIDSPRLLTATRDADWFDNSVHQVDGFGRQRTPGTHEGRRYAAEGWKERSVNTTITCSNPGCVARATLQLYDASKEDALLCKIFIGVHPTDFDDEHSMEHVEYWKVQDFKVGTQCQPKARGCNKTATRPLDPCVSGADIDKIVNRTSGNVVLEGKITQMVDECPYQGNLLSAVGTATCFVRDKVPTTTTTTMVAFNLSAISSTAILNCTTPGCIAKAKLVISPAIALNNGKCTMGVNVTMTDFDNSTNEKISYISVEGTQIVSAKDSNAQPTKNPCNEGYEGKSVPAAERIFQSVKEYDVTQLIMNNAPHGELEITGKISKQVDECAHEGNLLHAVVFVKCVPPAHFGATPPPYSSAFIDDVKVSQ